MEYLVNGVKYATIEEAQEAEKKLEEDNKKKAELAAVKKAKADEIQKAFTSLQEVETKAAKVYSDSVNAAKKLYSNTIKAAKDQYVNDVAAAQKVYEDLKNDFIKEYGSYHMSYYNDGQDSTISISDIVNTMFNFWF